ncbi:GNAT family N-acetyltransferase [Nocardiopsis ganjiahuensis]|uniref:GNAT family N-acetyltransferase n=1 Tax=Nocardiopsis ganjiahuensis TaxID=239984 RepID=UPI00034B2ECA|nr:GNAT family protein [Nocardiopsis ganjiahuensis]
MHDGATWFHIIGPSELGHWVVLLDHGLDDLGLHSVWALVHVDNVPSLRVAERLGFLPVGEGHHYDGPHRVHVVLPGAASTR